MNSNEYYGRTDYNGFPIRMQAELFSKIKNKKIKIKNKNQNQTKIVNKDKNSEKIPPARIAGGCNCAVPSKSIAYAL